MIALITVGSYTESPETFMGPIISTMHAEKILNAQKELKTSGGIPLIEMNQLQKGAAFLSPGLMDVTGVKKRPDDEIFGPFLQVVWVKDFQEAIDEANRTRFGMSAGLLSQNREEYDHFFSHIRAGVINWNSPLTMACSAAPFGGIKYSGNFRPSAYYAADYCAYPVASIETPYLILPEKLFPGLLTIRE